MNRPHPLLKSRKPVAVLVRSDDETPAQPTSAANVEVASGVRIVRLKPTPTQPAARVAVAEETPAPAPASAQTNATLADLVDQASAQLLVLRRTLDEAVSLTSAAHRQANELASEVAQSRSAGDELAQKLAHVGRSMTVLDKAADGIATLEDVLGRIGSLRDALAADFDRRLDRHKQDFESRLARMDQEFKTACSRQSERADAVIAELAARVESRIDSIENDMSRRIDAAESQGTLEIERGLERMRDHAQTAERKAAETEARMRDTWDRSAAEIDRRSAQAQARTSVLIDSAQQELAALESRAERIAQSADAQVREIAERVNAVTGGACDDWRQSAKPGSLPELVQHAEAVMTNLQLASGKARELTAGAAHAADEASARMDEALKRSDGRAALLERVMQDATRHAEDMALVARNLSELLGQAQRQAESTPSATPRRVSKAA